MAYSKTLLVTTGSGVDNLFLAGGKINTNLTAIETALGIPIPTGLLSARPTVGNAGAVYFATDAPATLYMDNGSSWVAVLTAGTTSGTIAAGNDSRFSDASGHISAAAPHSKHENTDNKNQASGYCGLDASGKVATAQLPDTVLGALQYKGTHDCSTLAYPLLPEAGDYYVASIEGTIATILYRVGDWLVYDGAAWGKVDNAMLVSSVAGRTGAVTLSSSDVGLANVTNDAQLKSADLDSDGTLTANSATKIPAQSAVKTYVDTTSVVVTGTAGETLSQYNCVYAKSDGKFWKADANTSATTADACGIVLQSGGITAEATGSIQVKPGLITNVGWSWTPMKTIYLNTAGGLTDDTATVEALTYGKPIGFSLTTTQILFFPQTGWSIDPYLELIVDQLELAYVPTGYTRTSTPEVTNTYQLSAHLAGIDAKLAELEGRIEAVE